jgi:hypothetical protein
MSMDCHCDDYRAGLEDQRGGRVISPYGLIHLRHGSCYRAGQVDERRRQLAEQRQNMFLAQRRRAYNRSA